MRIAVVSDIHGNLTALEAVLGDLREIGPSLVLQAGDLADAGSSPVEVIDRIRELGWPSVRGNTDEMLFTPQTLEAFAARSSAPPLLWEAIREGAAATRELLGPSRLAWLEGLPLTWSDPDLAVVHASPGDCWTVPSDSAAEAVYAALGRLRVVHGHTHVPSIHKYSGAMRLLVDGGSVGIPLDGDTRASYTVLEGGKAQIRRVAYDVEKEIARLRRSDLPHTEWGATMLRTGRPALP